MPTVTRKHVADHAGVSEATVSYVVNNGPRPVAADTRARVLKAIQELGYHPSDVARSLRMQRTSTVGLIVPDTANPFYGEIARAIEDVCHAHGYTAILCNSSLEPERETEYVNVLLSRRVMGAVIIPTQVSAVTRLMESDIATVVLETVIDGAYCLVADDFVGGQIVTDHLIQLGHRRIGFVTQDIPEGSLDNQQRLEGYKATLAQAGLPVEENLITVTSPNPASGEVAAFRLLDQPERPTAIIAHNDVIALGVLSAIRKRRLRVPDDISVTGFDDITPAAYYSPPLTTVAYHKRSVGQQAARLLIGLMQGAITQPPHTTTLELNLIARESTAPPNNR